MLQLLGKRSHCKRVQEEERSYKKSRHSLHNEADAEGISGHETKQNTRRKVVIQAIKQGPNIFLVKFGKH